MKTPKIVSSLFLVISTLTAFGDWELYGPVTPSFPGTFWSLSRGMSGPPAPCVPFIFSDAPVYGIVGKPGSYVYDDSDNPGHTQLSANSFSSAFPSGPGGGDFVDPWASWDTLRNIEKFMPQTFSLIDTNDAASNDTNLYNFLISFPDDTNTYPTLQIKLYGANAVIIKANHFDYSAETDRDFALLVSDSPDRATWKSINLDGSSDSQDGWRVQGLVSNWKVTDPMFMIVSNILASREAVFRAIPYGGPQVVLSGASDYDTVSNTLALQATINDLSGTTNEQFAVTVNGLPARYTISSTNTFNIDTHYAANSSVSGYYNEIDVTIGNTNALVSDGSIFTADTASVFETTTSKTLDFENRVYVAFASDMCSPDVGTNYIVFGVDQGQNVNAVIKDPATGRIVVSNSTSVSFPMTVGVPWDFKETNGVPYTNDTYTVTFAAQAGATTLTVTNRIDRHGVRNAAGTILTYEEEDPTTSAGPYLNSQANTWIGGLAVGLYEGLYYNDFASLTQYYPWQIGTDRDNPTWTSFPYVLTKANELSWPDQIHYSLTNRLFSDFGYYAGHGSGSGIGGGPSGTSWVTNWIGTSDVNLWCIQGASSSSNNWRMRKVVAWACYSGSPTLATANGVYPTWPAAFGIRPTAVQMTSWGWKNAGLFFKKELPQGGFGGNPTITSSYVAASLDSLWVEGKNAFPGGADPTYAFAWAVAQIGGMYPELNKKSVGMDGFGYPFLPFSPNYDATEILTNNPVDIKTH